jgi:hypothetical protein
MDATAGHMARRADELKKISEAAKPLYGSLRRYAEAQVRIAWPRDDDGSEWANVGGVGGDSPPVVKDIAGQ